MVRHILKKDWLLLWPLVAALAVLQVLLALARFSGGPLNRLPTTPGSLLVLVAAAMLITLVVHQDPIAGIGQDWLVRPIRRRDLFLAKLLFVVVLVQGPWWVTDLLQGLANGFSFAQSAGAATACAVWVLLRLSLPVLAFAALTATMTEALVAALGVLALLIAFLIVPGLVGAYKPAVQTGFAWVASLVSAVLLLASAASVLILQYRWRRTWAARALFAAALLAGQIVPFVLSWPTTIRLEQMLTANAQDDHDIDVTFVPAAGRFRLAPGQGIDDVQERPGFGPADVAAENQRRRAEGARTVFLPIRISGLDPDSRLLADRTEVRLIGRDGRVVYRGTGNRMELRATDAVATIHQGVRLPGAVYSRIKSDLLDVQLDYYFTLFRVDARYDLPARDGDQRMPGIGWCATRVNDAGTHVLFRCLQPGERPSCLAVVLEHTPTGRLNPEVSVCTPNYSPLPGHTLPDALSRFGGRLPFYDPAGFTGYPVGEAQLSEARVLVTNFLPTAHFVTRVLIPAVRLQDWEAQGTIDAGAPQ